MWVNKNTADSPTQQRDVNIFCHELAKFSSKIGKQLGQKWMPKSWSKEFSVTFAGTLHGKESKHLFVSLQLVIYYSTIHVFREFSDLVEVRVKKCGLNGTEK